MRVLLLLLLILALLTSGTWNCTADMSGYAAPEPDPAVIRSSQSGGPPLALLPGRSSAAVLLEVDGRRLGVLERAARLAPGYHTAAFILFRDASDFGDFISCSPHLLAHVGEVHFLARPEGRYVLRAAYEGAGADVRARAWLEDEVTGRVVAEARLETLGVSETWSDGMQRMRASGAM